MVIKVNSVKELTDSEKARYICQSHGYSLGDPFNAAQKGAQISSMYIVKRDNKEYILKCYMHRAGEDTCQDESGRFNEQAYQEQIKFLDDQFKIEKAVSTDKRLKNNEHIVNILVSDRITYDDGKNKLTEYYSIMEKYQPLSLNGTAKPNIRTEREALRLGIHICDALITLQHCTDIYQEPSKAGGYKGIYHGDIKYDNIFCYQKNNEYIYVLADFGVSTLKGNESTTFVGPVGGTLYTMAPEVALEHKFSLKADLYSLCATLYLLVNKGSFKQAAPEARVGEKRPNEFYLAKETPMQPPKNCSKEMQELLVNGLEAKPEDRKCKSPEELKGALLSIQHHLYGTESDKELEKRTAGIDEFFAEFFAADRVPVRKDATESERERAKNALKEISKEVDRPAHGEDVSFNTHRRASTNHKRIKRAKPRFSNKNILRLLSLCLLGIGSLAGCIVSPIFMEYAGKENLFFVPCGIGIVLGFILLYIIWLSKSYYAWLVTDLTCVLFGGVLIIYGAYIWQLTLAIIIKVLLEIILFGEALVFGASAALVDDENYPVSSVLIYNYIPGSISIILSAGMIFFDNDISAALNLEWLQKEDVYNIGWALTAISIALLIFKLVYYKEIKVLSRKRKHIV